MPSGENHGRCRCRNNLKALNSGSLSFEMKICKATGEDESDTHTIIQTSGPEMVSLVLTVEGLYPLPNNPTQKVAQKNMGRMGNRQLKIQILHMIFPAYQRDSCI